MSTVRGAPRILDGPIVGLDPVKSLANNVVVHRSLDMLCEVLRGWVGGLN